HAERLTQESLNLTRPVDRELVFRREFIHAKNSDDVLEVFVALQHTLDAASDLVMFLADDLRRQSTGSRSQRIDCGVNSQLCDGTCQDDSSVQVSKRSCGGWVRQVVGRHVYRLERGDGAFLG